MRTFRPSVLRRVAVAIPHFAHPPFSLSLLLLLLVVVVVVLLLSITTTISSIISISTMIILFVWRRAIPRQLWLRSKFGVSPAGFHVKSVYYVCIYIYIERERDVHKVYIYIYIHILCVYTYIYIYIYMIYIYIYIYTYIFNKRQEDGSWPGSASSETWVRRATTKTTQTQRNNTIHIINNNLTITHKWVLRATCAGSLARTRTSLNQIFLSI